jgi:hypothetical protein
MNRVMKVVSVLALATLSLGACSSTNEESPLFSNPLIAGFEKFIAEDLAAKNCAGLQGSFDSVLAAGRYPRKSTVREQKYIDEAMVGIDCASQGYP